MRLPGTKERRISHLREATDAPAAPAFDWPIAGAPGPPSVPPEEPPRRRGDRGRFRRRRLVALGVLVLLVAGLGVLVAWLVGRDNEGKLTPRQQAQLEAAAPGGRAPAEPPAVRGAAARLTLPKQVAQVFFVGANAQYPRDAFFPRLRTRGWGGVVLAPDNFVDRDQFDSLTGAMGAAARRARQLPPLVAAIQAGGASSTIEGLPPRAQPLIGDRGNVAHARGTALAAARGLSKLGVRMTLAPVADVGTAAGPLQGEVYGEDGPLVARMTAAAVAGWRAGGVTPVVGHFPGQGSATEDPSVATASVGLSLPEMRRRDLLPFRAVARRAPVIMTSNAIYAAYDGVTPATLLPPVYRLLRGGLGYRGVVMTDDLKATSPVLGIGVGTAAVKAFEAGADLLYVSGGPRDQERAYRAVLQAVRNGRISRERLRVSVLRVLALKRGHGLLPRPAARRRAPSRPAQPSRRAY